MHPGFQYTPAVVVIGEPSRLAADVVDGDAFRERVLAFLEAHVPRKEANADDEGISPGGIHDSSPELVARVRAYQAALYDHGLAGLTWPPEYGGQGLGARHQQIFNEVASEFDVTTRIVGIGLGMVGPTLLGHGTEDQRRRYLRPLLRGDEIWCQLFSEPGAGSDIAAVQARAIRDEDGWLVNGQKVWSSVAHHADFGLLLARTNVDVPKHAGLSMFVMPMDAPGVEVRPLRQMDGGANFNEVFLVDVRLTDDAVVGAVDDGWSVARTTLSNERVAVSGGRQGNGSLTDPLLRLVRQLGGVADPVIRQELAAVYTTDRILRLLQARAQVARESGRAVGPEGSVAKLLNTQLQKRVAAARTRVLGARAVAFDSDDVVASGAACALLASPAASIAGGTDEVQRNILAERMLGLPREPAVDRGRPFRLNGATGTQR